MVSREQLDGWFPPLPDKDLDWFLRAALDGYADAARSAGGGYWGKRADYYWKNITLFKTPVDKMTPENKQALASFIRDEFSRKTQWLDQETEGTSTGTNWNRL